jgi:hypothetical protein
MQAPKVTNVIGAVEKRIMGRQQQQNGSFNDSKESQCQLLDKTIVQVGIPYSTVTVSEK